jgi:hypothetical protein
MSKLGFAVLGLCVVSVFSVGCDKKDEGAAKAAASAAPAAASGPAAKNAAPGAAAAANANDPIVCCKFGAVKGSSTKKVCEDGKGTVVPDAECPMLKK